MSTLKHVPGREERAKRGKVGDETGRKSCRNNTYGKRRGVGRKVEVLS